MTTLAELKTAIRKHNIKITGRKYADLIKEYNEKSKIQLPVNFTLTKLKDIARDNAAIRLTYVKNGVRIAKNKAQLLEEIEQNV